MLVSRLLVETLSPGAAAGAYDIGEELLSGVCWMKNIVAAWRRVGADFAFAWRALFATDVLYKLLALAVLVPLVAVMLRLFLHLSGNVVKADQDILFFVLSPLGIVTLIVIGAGLVAVLAMETACLLCIARAARRRLHLPVLAALRFTLLRAHQLLRVTALLVIRFLLLALPFLLLAALIVYWLLSEHDINFYLAEKPPEFLVAAACVAVVLVVLAGAVVRKLAAWFFVLPLVLFEGVSPPRSFAVSERRTTGRRREIAFLVTSWFVVFAVLSGALLGLVRAGASLATGLSGDRMPLLVTALALVLFAWFAASFLLNLLTNCFFALFVADRYFESAEAEGRVVARLDADAALQGGPLAARVVTGVVVLVTLVAVGAGLILLRGVQITKPVTVVAHRGAAGHAPENTLAAIETAIEMGADSVEIDVQETADGVVVVMHDSDLMKIGGVPLKVWDATHEQISSHDIGSWFAPAFADQRVPTLDDVLELVEGRVRLTIELKYYGHDQNLEQRVIDLVEARGMESEVVLISLKYAALEKVRALRPEWKLGLLTARALGDLTRVDVDFLAVNVGMASRRFVRRAHAAGKEVYVWTANDAGTLSRMVSHGVDGLITDYPDLARSVLRQRDGLGSVERLMLDLGLYFGLEPAPVDIAAETVGEQ